MISFVQWEASIYLQRLAEGGQGVLVGTLRCPMVTAADPTLDNALTGAHAPLDLGHRIVLLVFLVLVLVRHKVHPDLLSDNCCLKHSLIISILDQIKDSYLRIGARLITLAHSKLGPAPSRCHGLGDHLPLNLVGPHHLDLLAVLVEDVLRDDLGVALHLL